MADAEPESITIVRWNVFTAHVFADITAAVVVWAQQTQGADPFLSNIAFPFAYAFFYAVFLITFVIGVAHHPPLAYMVAVLLYFYGYAGFAMLYSRSLIFGISNADAKIDVIFFCLCFLAGSVSLMYTTSPWSAFWLGSACFVVGSLLGTAAALTEPKFKVERFLIFGATAACLMGRVFFLVGSAKAWMRRRWKSCWSIGPRFLSHWMSPRRRRTKHEGITELSNLIETSSPTLQRSPELRGRHSWDTERGE